MEIKFNRNEKRWRRLYLGEGEGEKSKINANRFFLSAFAFVEKYEKYYRYSFVPFRKKESSVPVPSNSSRERQSG